MDKKTKIRLANILFIVVVTGIGLFLYMAPPESTAPLPSDEIHAQFQTMPKKVAEKNCDSCHGDNGEAPLSSDHPPKFRCLFCHKQHPENLK